MSIHYEVFSSALLVLNDRKRPGMRNDCGVCEVTLAELNSVCVCVFVSGEKAEGGNAGVFTAVCVDCSLSALQAYTHTNTHAPLRCYDQEGILLTHSFLNP